MKISFATTEAMLRRILDRNPRASLREIRSAHPAFRAMSYDRLTVRVTQLLERGTGLSK